MDVDGELGPLQAEHEDAGDRLGADALKPRQLGLDGLVIQLPDRQQRHNVTAAASRCPSSRHRHQRIVEAPSTQLCVPNAHTNVRPHHTGAHAIVSWLLTCDDACPGPVAGPDTSQPCSAPDVLEAELASLLQQRFKDHLSERWGHRSFGWGSSCQLAELASCKLRRSGRTDLLAIHSCVPLYAHTLARAGISDCRSPAHLDAGDLDVGEAPAADGLLYGALRRRPDRLPLRECRLQPRERAGRVRVRRVLGQDRPDLLAFALVSKLSSYAAHRLALGLAQQCACSATCLVLSGPQDKAHTVYAGGESRQPGPRTSESSTVRCSFGGASNSEGLSTFAAVTTLRGAEGEPCSLASASLAACRQQPRT